MPSLVRQKFKKIGLKDKLLNITLKQVRLCSVLVIPEITNFDNLSAR